MAGGRAIRVLGFVLLALVLGACAVRSSSREESPPPAAVEATFFPPSSPTPVPCACAPSGEPVASPTPRDVSTPAPGWFSVTDLSQPDKGDEIPGDTDIALTIIQARFGTLVAETDADAGCVAKGNFPSGALIKGLGFRRADSAGNVAWVFTTPLSERGFSTYTVTCSKQANQRTARVLFFIN